MKPHVALAFALYCRPKKSGPSPPGSGPAVINQDEVKLYAYTVKMRSGMVREMKTLGRSLSEAKMFAQREVDAYNGTIIKPVSLSRVYEWSRTT